MLQPLAPGKHKLSFSAEYHNPDQAYGMMVQDIEYQLEVVEPDKPAPQFKLVEDRQPLVDKGI